MDMPLGIGKTPMQNYFATTPDPLPYIVHFLSDSAQEHGMFFRTANFNLSTPCALNCGKNLFQSHVQLQLIQR